MYFSLSELVTELIEVHTCQSLPFQKLTLPRFCLCSPQEEFNGKPDSLFFTDGQRRIDFVLVYEDETKKENNKKGTNEKQRVGSFFFSVLISLIPFNIVR